MNRVATIPLQQTLAGAMQRTQQKLAASQAQLSTGRKAETLGGLGSSLVPTLSARSVMARQEAQGAVSTRVGTTLALYNNSVSEIETIGSDLRERIMGAIATGTGGKSLQEGIEAAFDQFRAQLNTSPGGVPLFSGSQAGEPFKPTKLSDTVGLDPADAFANDNIRASARVADGTDLEYGVVASDVGKDLLSAFRTLAEAGPSSGTLDDSQIAVLKTALGQVDGALGGIRSVNAEVGRKQAQVETLATRSEDRVTMLKEIIAKSEEADLGQVAMDITQHKSILEASYAVFGKLAGVSLLNFLR